MARIRAVHPAALRDRRGRGLWLVHVETSSAAGRNARHRSDGGRRARAERHRDEAGPRAGTASARTGPRARTCPNPNLRPSKSRDRRSPIRPRSSARKQERLASRAEVEQQKLEQEQKAAQELKEREDAEKLEAEKKAAAKAAADKAAAEKAAADKKALEKKRAEDAAAAKKAAEEKARHARQAELRRALEAEERGNAMRNSDEANRWHAQIVARMTRAWIKPPSAQPGISCIVSVTQVPGGEVTAVRVNSCSIDDAALRESVEAAVYRASPLPHAAGSGVPFERNLELTFAPHMNERMKKLALSFR